MVETLILHAGSRVTWRDGSSTDETDAAAAREAMLPVNARLRFVRDTAQTEDLPPASLTYTHKVGEMTLLQGTSGRVVPRAPVDADFATIAGTAFTLRGVVLDDQRRYQPRALALDFPAAGADRDVAVYPAPGALSAPNGGLLRGTLRYEDDGRPGGFARIALTVTVGARSLRFRAQADAAGEFALRLISVPPLRAGVDPYPATLTAAAEPVDDGIPVTDPATRRTVAVVDPDALGASLLGEVGVLYPDEEAADGGAAPLAFAAEANFVVRPGLTGILRSRGRGYVALAPA